jgi:hypothetical protein
VHNYFNRLFVVTWMLISAPGTSLSAGSPGAWPATAPSPSSRFGPSVEVKERLHLPALQRLSGLNKALPLFYLLVASLLRGLPWPCTPAGVFVPSATITRYKIIVPLNLPLQKHWLGLAYDFVATNFIDFCLKGF